MHDLAVAKRLFLTEKSCAEVTVGYNLQQFELIFLC